MRVDVRNRIILLLACWVAAGVLVLIIGENGISNLALWVERTNAAKWGMPVVLFLAACSKTFGGRIK